MKYFLYIFFLLIPFQLSAQINDKYVDIDKKLKINASLMKTKPRKALMNLREIKGTCLNVKYQQGAIKSTLLISEILFQTIGDHNQAFIEFNSGLHLAKKTNDFSAIIQFHQYRSAAYFHQGFMDLGFRDLQEALSHVSRLKDPDEQNLKFAHLYAEMARYYQSKNDSINHIRYLQKSLKIIKFVSDTTIFHIAKKRIMAMQFTDLAHTFNRSKQIDSAEINYQVAFNLYTKYDLPMFEKSQLLLAMCKFYFQEGDYVKAIHLGKSGLGLREENNQPKVKKEFYHLLHKSYLECNQIDSCKYFAKLYSTLNDSIFVNHYSTVNTTFEEHREQQELSYQNRIKKFLLIDLGSLTVLALGVTYWSRTSKRHIHQEYNKLKNEEYDEENIAIENNQKEIISHTKNGINIPDNTLTNLLKKLEKFEKTNKFNKQDLTLSSLANDLDSNTRYISYIIKEYRGKNFNNYINALRIAFITKKLYDDPQFRKYKVAYLANYAGFTSATSFTTIFKKETGMTPSYFISQLDKEE